MSNLTGLGQRRSLQAALTGALLIAVVSGHIRLILGDPEGVSILELHVGLHWDLDAPLQGAMSGGLLVTKERFSRTERADGQRWQEEHLSTMLTPWWRCYRYEVEPPNGDDFITNY